MAYKIVSSITLVLMFAALHGCVQSQKETKDDIITKIGPSEFKVQSKGKLIVDVRSAKEFADAHIEGAVNNDIYDDNFSKNVKGFDKDKPIFVYCKSGKRSNMAAEKLSGMGFKKIYDLEGGIVNWMKSNYQTDSDNK